MSDHTETQDHEEDTLTPIEEQNLERMAEILDAFNAGPDSITWNIRVSQVTGNNRRGDKELFLFNCDPSELPIEERLIRDYGTGTYRARVMRNGRLFRQFDIPVLAPAPKQEAPTTDLAAILAAIERSNAAAAERVERFLERVATPGTVTQTQLDPFAMLEKMSTIIANMNRTAPQAAPSNSLETTLSVVEKIMDMSQNFGGEKRNAGMMDILRDLVKSPILGQLMEGAAANMAALPRPNSPPPQRVPMQPNAPQTQQPPPPPDNPLVQAVRYLVTRAQANANPSLYAEWLLDNLPPEMAKQLLPQQNLVMQLEQAIPEVTPHRIWFQFVIDEARTMMESDGGQPGTGDDGADAINGRAGRADVDARNPQVNASPDA
jgi:hypothetical protein